MNEYQILLNIILASHIARIYGENQAVAIKRAARNARAATRDVKMSELLRSYSQELEPATIDGRRVSGDERKVLNVARLEADLRKMKLI